MALPQFTTTTKIADGKTTTLSTVVRAYNTAISNLNQIFTSLLKRVQLDSILLEDKVVSGNTIIPHTLGRTLTGWQIVRQSGPALLWDTQQSNPKPETYLYLNSTAKITVSILVF